MSDAPPPAETDFETWWKKEGLSASGAMLSYGHNYKAAKAAWQFLASRLKAVEAELENANADLGNLGAYKQSAREGSRQLRQLFSQYGIDEKLNWGEWFEAVSRHAARVKAVEDERDEWVANAKNSFDVGLAWQRRAEAAESSLSKVEEQLAEARKGKPDDLRASGWSVAVHNDYRINGEPMTFWLFTKDGKAIKGEGPSDEAALEQVRHAARAESQVKGK